MGAARMTSKRKCCDRTNCFARATKILAGFLFETPYEPFPVPMHTGLFVCEEHADDEGVDQIAYDILAEALLPAFQELGIYASPSSWRTIYSNGELGSVRAIQPRGSA